ncbi:hypothetical protein AtubIFM55763_008386 [Aspergillus tubingensis]|nr:hypothetical protein AtubIFM55763_008386 [Aspergillus tubingensis]GLB13298.1 hypothetical protein AtubIFM61612_000704 [Aspergillus tubingensis]
MPQKAAQQAGIPEGRGVRYDEIDMALFRAKLSYHATAEERMASRDPNLVSISEHQARLLRLWEMHQHSREGKNGGNMTPAERNQLAQFQWRYKRLEDLATQGTSLLDTCI